jgi:hypothetical protein
MFVYLLSAVCVIVGLGTRFNIAVVLLLLVSFMNRNPGFWHHCDSTMVALGLPLIFSAAGKKFSVDCWLRKRSNAGFDDELYEPWAQRLIQIYTVTMYWCAFWGKLNGIPWWNGTAVYYVAHMESFQRFSIAHFVSNLWISCLLTWTILAIEFSLWSLIWLKEFRYWVLLAGVLFHLSISYCMDLDLLEYVMIATYITFIDPDDLRRWLKNVQSRLFAR